MLFPELEAVLEARLAAPRRASNMGPSELHQHRLGLEVRLEPEPALLVADAAFLVAAERQRRVDHRVAVDPHRAGLELAGNTVRGADVLGPHARGEAVRRVVGFLDYL